MIRVIIADDFSAIEEVMRAMIEAADDMELVGVATRFNQALEMVKEQPHDVIVLNDYLPPMRSPDAIRIMRAEGVESAIIVVSMHSDAELARDALAEGASGYVLKPNFMDEFLDAVRQAHAGDRCSSPEIVSALKEWLGDAADELLGG